MGATRLDPHLQNGKGESLARAKAALKDRLRQKMMQEALNELQDTEHVVDTAMEALDSEEQVMKTAREALKARLFEHLRGQAIAEVLAEADVSDLHGQDGDETLAKAKDVFKQRLLDQVLRQAIDEAGEEISGAQDPLTNHGEALSEAREVFKTRLRDQVIEQAVADADADVRTDADALSSHGEALGEAREVLKTRLRDQVVEQAVAEAGPDAARISYDQLAGADRGALDEIKDALKHRLLDQVYHQAIAEIDAEVDGSPDDLPVFAETAPRPESHDPQPDFIHEAPGDEASFAQETDDPLFESQEDDPIIELQFWDEEETAEEVGDPSDELALRDDATQEGDDSGFFLSDLSEPGSDSGAMLADEWAEAPVEDLFDFVGDGAWEDPVPLSDSSANPEAPQEEEPTLFYVYGVFSGDFAAEDVLPLDGIDAGFSLFPLKVEHGVALVSKVSDGEFGEQALAVNKLDPVWTEERTRAHEAIVQRLSGEGLFLPAPFCTVTEHEDTISQLFTEINYKDALDRIKGRSQWCVRLFRNVDVLHQQVVQNSPAVQQLMAEIKSKPKGGAHTIKKKMVSTIHEEEASLTDYCTKDVHERLFSRSDDVELGALGAEGDREKNDLILEATYLVHRDHHRAFTDDLEQLEHEYAPQGFAFEVTGPEPPTLFSQLIPFSKA